MHMSELLRIELSAYRERTGKTALNILETGTIRDEREQYQQNDGWSTLTFAEDVRDNGGDLVGVDLFIGAAENVLSAAHLREFVTLHQGYSVDVLAGMLELPKESRPSFDVVLLDSDNEGNLILHEFMIAKRLMAKDAMLLLDDVNLSSPHVFKGDKIIPWLTEHGHVYRTLRRTGTNYATDVVAVDF